MAKISIIGDEEIANAIKRAIAVFNGYSVEYCKIENSFDNIKNHPHIIVIASPYLKDDQKLILSTILWSALVRDEIRSASAISGLEFLDIGDSEYSLLQSFVAFFSPCFELPELLKVFTKESPRPRISLSIKSTSPLTRAIGRLNHDALDKLGMVIRRVSYRETISEQDQLLWKENISLGKKWCGVCECIFRAVTDLFTTKDCQNIKSFLNSVDSLLRAENITSSNIRKIKDEFDGISGRGLYKIGREWR